MKNVHGIHVAKECISERDIEITSAPVVDSLEGGNTSYPSLSIDGERVTNCAQVERMDGVLFPPRECR